MNNTTPKHTMPKCKICKSKFTASNSLKPTCDEYDCKVAYALKVAEKNNAARERKEKRDHREWKAKTKESHITPSQRLSKLQDEVNHIARLIDKGHGCMSCEAPPKKINGGHLRSVASSGNIRFNLFNIFAQCNSCNSDKGGNTTAYCDKLIRVFGKERFEYCFFDLMRLYPRLSPSADQIIEWTKIARKIVAELKNADQIYTTEERWELREKYNQKLGIYTIPFRG